MDSSQLSISDFRLLKSLIRIAYSSTDKKSFVETSFSQISHYIKNICLSFWRFDAETNQLVLSAFKGGFETFPKEIKVQVDANLPGRAALTRKPIHLDQHQIKKMQTAMHPFGEITDYQAYDAVPVFSDGVLYGILEFFHQQARQPQVEWFEISEAFGELFSLYFEKFDLRNSSAQQAGDLTRLQAQLIDRERIASIGELVAGVSHELNTPIASILAYAQLIQNRTAEGSQDQADLEKIILQAGQASKILKGLLDYARQRPNEIEPVQINHIITQSLDLVMFDLRAHNITCQLDLCPELPKAMIDPNQMQQVFINLINNAWHAMFETNNGGKLTITTRTRKSDAAHQQKALIRIEVVDNGPGITEDNLSKIFTPFFTTKPRGRGTGLGLSICRNIIQTYHGAIWVENQVDPAKGARFIIELPVDEEEPMAKTLENEQKPAPTKTESEPELFEGNRDVLLLEDELILSEVMTRALEDAGFAVAHYQDGRAGWDALKTNQYRVIICDIHLPEMNGIKIHSLLHENNPEMAKKMIFITGDLMSSSVLDFFKDTNAVFLNKPFELSKLIEAVKSVFSA